MGAPWTGAHAYARNCSIIAQSSCLVIPEAAPKGGTMNTGRAALKRQSPLFVTDFGPASQGFETRLGNKLLLNAGPKPLKKDRTTGRPCIKPIRHVLNLI